MENQQPGQVFPPQPKDNDNTDPVDSNQNPNNNSAQPQTPSEIEQIDSAMQNQPQDNDASDLDQNIDTDETDISTESREAPEQPLPTQIDQDNLESEKVNQARVGQRTVETDNSDNRPDDLSAPQESESIISWQAAEPAESFSGSRLLLIIGGMGVLVTIGAFIVDGFGFSSIFGAVVIFLGIVALAITNKRPGHMEEYAIYPEGVMISQKFYPFSELRAFNIVTHGGAENVELLPAKRFMPSLSVYLESATAEAVVDTLSQRIPLEEREPDLVDRISQRLRM